MTQITKKGVKQGGVRVTNTLNCHQHISSYFQNKIFCSASLHTVNV